MGRPDRVWGLLLGLLLAASVLEDPYTLLPGVVVALGFGIRRLSHPGGVSQVAMAVVGGAAPILGRLAQVGDALGGNQLPREPLTWMGQSWQRYDLSTFSPTQLAWPWPLPDFSLGTQGLIDTGGGHFLGWTALVLAACGLGRGGGRWLLAAAAALVVALGSAPFSADGPPGPYLFLNLALSAALPPLTQPARFVPIAVVFLAVAAAIGATRLASLWARTRLSWAPLFVLLLAEGLTLGGPAVDVPGTPTRALACFGQVDHGAVHAVLPEIDPDTPKIRQDMLLQLYHQRPGTHRGIGGWARDHRAPRVDESAAALKHQLRVGQGADSLAPTLRALAQDGIDWIIAPGSMDHGALGPPEVACGGWRAWRIARDRGRH